MKLIHSRIFRRTGMHTKLSQVTQQSISYFSTCSLLFCLVLSHLTLYCGNVGEGKRSNCFGFALRFNSKTQLIQSPQQDMIFRKITYHVTKRCKERSKSLRHWVVEDAAKLVKWRGEIENFVRHLSKQDLYFGPIAFTDEVDLSCLTLVS